MTPRLILFVLVTFVTVMAVFPFANRLVSPTMSPTLTPNAELPIALPPTPELPIALTNEPQPSRSASQTIYYLSAAPNVIQVNQPRLLTITADIGTDPSLLRESVTCLLYDMQNQFVKSLGPMYDDRTHGDTVAGDNVFTTQVTFTESAPTTLFLKVSAAYRGLLSRVTSDVIPLFVVNSLTAEQMLIQLASELETGNVTAAAQRFSAKRGNREQIMQMTATGRNNLAAGLRQARLEEGDENIRIYDVPILRLDGTTYRATFTLFRSASGDWVIDSW